jgi:hypothetical protein
MKWLLVLSFLIGAYLNCMRDWRGLIFWIVTDSTFCVKCALDGGYAEACIFGLYALFASLGLYVWRKNENL